MPPTAVVAEQDGPNAVVTWNEPGVAGPGEWLTKGGEENNDGIGTGAAGVVFVSHMYTEAELADYQGMYINSIKFFPREGSASYSVKVWGGAAGDVELYSQTVPSFEIQEWNEYTLDSSVAIPATGPLYIGYTADTPGGYPAGCDAGPAVAGGDMIKTGNQATWDVLSQIADINVNWNIQAYVSWSRGNQVASAEGKQIMRKHSPEVNQRAEFVRGNLRPITSPTNLPNRAFEGYKVWRLLDGEQNNETNWTLLTDNIINDLTYTDNEWNEMDSGLYRYAVKAIYTNDNLSAAAFSNILLKDMYGSVDGMVMNESGAPISGATVTLDGTTVTTDGSGYFLFTEAFAIEQAITASAIGYTTVTQSITVIGAQLTTIDFTLAISNVIISDSFESYPDFAHEAGRWVMVDRDMSGTYSIDGYEFPGTYEPMAYIIFNHAMTTPPLEDNFAARTGSKYAACFAATAGPNNDWMITEPINLADSGTFSFWGRSIQDNYGLENFNVLVSTGSANPDDFTSISGPTSVQAPVDWTYFSYDLDQYANQTIRIAIQCVSDDVFLFMVDDVEINAPGATDNQDNDAIAISALMGNYPNPFNPETTISFSTKESGQISLDIYNIKGQKVRTLINDHRDSGKHTVVWNGKDDNGKSVASGVFFYRMKSGKFSSTKKMILMK